MPPSSMTAATGTQRLTTSAPAAQPGAAARHENWSGLEHVRQPARPRPRQRPARHGRFGVRLQRRVHGRAASRARRTRTASSSATRPSRRTPSCAWSICAPPRSSSSTTSRACSATGSGVTRRGHDDGDPRSRRQRGQQPDAAAPRADRASPCVSSTKPRAGRQETALEEVPDESFDVAFHRLFDDPQHRRRADRERAADRIARCAAPADRAWRRGTSRGRRPGRALSRVAAPGCSGPSGAPASHLAGAARRRIDGPVPTHRRTRAPAAPARGQGTGTAHADEPWRTGRHDARPLRGARQRARRRHRPRRGRLLRIGARLRRARSSKASHDQIHPGHARGTRPQAPTARTDAAHAHRGRRRAAGSARRCRPRRRPRLSGAAHETVEHIVGDPYALDELANRLYPNIRTRLRQELLVDRERAGLLADFR